MKRLTPKRGYKRGYAVALLVGLEENQAAIWKVFSNVIKPEKTIILNGFRVDSKAVYNFHEQIINALRPMLKEGVRSIILASSSRINYSEKFFDHIKNHHGWLYQSQNRAAFSQIVGSALTISQVTELAKNPEFKKNISITTMEETENIIDLLEKTLNAPNSENLVLYSIDEIENQVLCSWLPGKPKPDYMLITDRFLSSFRQKNRLQRIIQIASNRKIKTRIIKADSPSGKRLNQLGGFVCLQIIE